MLSRSLVVAVFCLLAASAAVARSGETQGAKSKGFAKSEHVLAFINGYRDKKEPKRLPAAVKAFVEHGLIKDPEQSGIYIGFIAGVLGENPATAEKLVTEMFPMPPVEQAVLVKAIAYSGLPDWKALMGKFVERMPARKVLIEKHLYRNAPTLETLSLDADGGTPIDINWGYFFATGARQPASRIIGALAWSTERNDVEKLTIGAMAKWTLASNASRDKTLLDIAKAELNTQPEEVRRPLREVIEAAETFETGRIKREALKAIEELKVKGPQSGRDFVWWGQAGQTVLAAGCVAAGALGQVQVGIPCVLGGALSSAALHFLKPGQ
jgi:hypothetical protein